MSRQERAPVRIESNSVRIAPLGTALRLTYAAIASIVFACPAGIVLTARDNGLVQLLGLAVMLSPFALFFTAALAPALTRARPGTVTVDADTMTIDREGKRAIRVPLAKLGEGYLRPHGAQPEAHIRLPNGNVAEIGTGTIAVAESLLEAARLDPSQRRVTVKLRRIFFTLVYWLAGAPAVATGAVLSALAISRRLGIAAAGPVIASLLLGLATVAFASRRLLGPDLTIGADGVHIRELLRSQFISYGDLRSVALREGQIWFNLRDGGIVSVWADSDVQPPPSLAVDRIEQARELFARGAHASESARVLSRDGRSVSTWKTDLRAAIDRVGTYRSAAVSLDDLRKVVTDVAASVEQRIGAALALGASGNDEDRERVRVAAEACASEPIRVALSRAGEGTLDEREVEAAIAAERKA